MIRFRLVLIAGMLISGSSAFAQSRGGGNTGGGLGSGTLTTSQATGGMSGMPSVGGTSGGRSSTGGATGMPGGTGGRGGGAAGQQGSQLGQTQSQFNLGDGSLGQQIGQSGFVGQSNNQTFIGNRFAGQNGAQGAQPNFSGLQNLSNQNQNQNQRNMQQSNSASRQAMIRTQLRVDFAAPAVNFPQLRTATLERLSTLPTAEGVQLSMNGEGVATLQGSVATENDRRVLEAFVRMEPGVRDVKNEIIVLP